MAIRSRFYLEFSVLVVLSAVFGAVACTTVESGQGGDAGADAAEEVPVAFAVQLPVTVTEGGPFVVGLTVLLADNRIATSYSGAVEVSTDWGDLSVDAISIEQGVGEVVATLNREGLATLRFTDGQLDQTGSLTVEAAGWTRNPEDHVLLPSLPVHPNDPYHWSAGGLRGVRALREGDGLWAYFTSPADPAEPAMDEDDAVLGRAYSTNDGLTWTLDPFDAPIAAAADFGVRAIADPFVIRGGDGLWHLWLSALDGPEGGESWRILHAQSSDGLQWTVETCLALHPAPGSVWMGAHVKEPSIVPLAENLAGDLAGDPAGDRYRIYFTAYGTSGGVPRIGAAEGSCAEPFSQPRLVLEVGGNQTWDGVGIHTPFVWQDGSVWKLLFAGQGGVSAPTSLGYASSSDGFDWIRSPANPVFKRDSAPGSLSSSGVRCPTVMALDGGRLMLLFEGRNVQGRATGGRALGPHL